MSRRDFSGNSFRCAICNREQFRRWNANKKQQQEATT